MRITRGVTVLMCLLMCPIARPAFSQSAPTPQQSLQVPRYNCPGDPPGNLASFDCRFTKAQRAEHLVTSSVTDQAMLGAALTAAFAHVRNDPPEWSRRWDGYGRRAASRYERKLLGGTAQFAVGALLGDDHRHVTYAADPLIETRRDGVSPRLQHAFMDWLMVRRSAKDARGRRLPNLPLFAGALANGFAGYTWLPDREATIAASFRRAAGPLETALLGSLYSEFGPEIGRMLGAIFKRGRVPSPARVPEGK